MPVDYGIFLLLTGSSGPFRCAVVHKCALAHLTLRAFIGSSSSQNDQLINPSNLFKKALSLPERAWETGADPSLKLLGQLFANNVTDFEQIINTWYLSFYKIGIIFHRLVRIK